MELPTKAGIVFVSWLLNNQNSVSRDKDAQLSGIEQPKEFEWIFRERRLVREDMKLGRQREDAVPPPKF